MSGIKLGVVGAAGRGAAFKEAVGLSGLFEVYAVCDSNAERLQSAREQLGARLAFHDFQEMLDRSDVEAVLIATPMPFHVPQAVTALGRNIHVLSEVPAGVSLKECERLVRAASSSQALYMLAENYCYRRPAVLVEELVRRGLFGEPYYGRGEYLHELKELNEQTPWRRRWQTGINGITYPTHSLAPLLRWFGADRVSSVCYAGSGHHYEDARGHAYELEDTGVMLARTERNRLICIRVDMLSDRPHGMTNYELQGTDGAYESARDGSENGLIWLKTQSGLSRQWRPLSDFANYLPERWKNAPEAVAAAGHGGGDYWVLQDFGESILQRRPSPIDIHAAMDMTLPGLISQLSAAQGGGWLPVPDSRTWLDAVDAAPQLQMIYPVEEIGSPPEPCLPPGFQLRQLALCDHRAYLQLMFRAGFSDWSGNESRLQSVRQTALPDGYFVVEHIASGALVATAVATHHPDDLHPEGGELGWVAARPEHAGKGLGLAVTTAVVRRFVRAGYKRIYLRTDDHRLAAIATYMRAGFRPFSYQEGMTDRWANVDYKLRQAKAQRTNA